MPRLTLARAVARAPPINARAIPPTYLRIMIPGTRGTVLSEATQKCVFVNEH